MRQLSTEECNKLIYHVGKRMASAIQKFTSDASLAEKMATIISRNKKKLSGNVASVFIPLADFLRARIENKPESLESTQRAVDQARIQLESLQGNPLYRDWKEEISAALKDFDIAVIFSQSDDASISLDAATAEFEKRGRTKE